MAKTFSTFSPELMNMSHQNPLGEESRVWKNKFNDFTLLTRLFSETRECQMAKIRRCLGNGAWRIIQPFSFTEDGGRNDKRLNNISLAAPVKYLTVLNYSEENDLITKPPIILSSL
ncbi:hypothetical protein FBUS_07293 [Fasciolopsis buskii]|uniref:Uncharacterized protein n=1 Tax=Fasciolopsis buskii TaxID=27845 RepID=A0A8E0S2N0_9TREM|nr:hypothetical protein FBUS_07293 [Fasciolopsis buski]